MTMTDRFMRVRWFRSQNRDYDMRRTPSSSVSQQCTRVLRHGQTAKTESTQRRTTPPIARRIAPLSPDDIQSPLIPPSPPTDRASVIQP